MASTPLNQANWNSNIPVVDPGIASAQAGLVDAKANAAATAAATGGTIDANGNVVMPTSYQTGPVLNDKSSPPVAPAGYQYTWIGGTATGSWKLYSTGQPTGTGTAASATGATAQTATPGGSANANPGALQIITDALKAAGLGSLASQAWTMWNKGYDLNAIMDDPTNGIRASAVYKQNFPAMAALNAKGQGISEAAYLAKEQADLELLKQYGIPAGVFDSKDYLGSLMTNNVTTQDLQNRLIAVQDTVNSFDDSIKQYAADTYGLDSGHLMAWALDPTKALPVIQNQAKAMQIGGAALKAGFGGGLGANGELSTSQAEALGAANVSQAQAQQGFVNLAQMGQLAENLPGDTSGSVSNQQMINAQFGLSGTDTAAVKKVQAKRVAEYQQGGSFAATASGAGGLGSANAAS